MTTPASPTTAPTAAPTLLRLTDVPGLAQGLVTDWHRAHLNPALIRLMRLGGYDDVRIVRARGPYLFTDDGRRLLDLVSAYGALSHGHNHPRVVAASRWFDELGEPDLLKEFPSAWTAALAHNLCAVAPGDLDTVFFCNSGTEAVEGALKVAQRHFAGTRDRFVYCVDSLHGKTHGTLSITGREKYRAHVRRFDDWPMIPFGDIEALRRVLAADAERRIAGFVVEPIQGEGGVVVPPDGYLRDAARRVKEHGALLILDEIQTGFGRTGTLFRCEAEGVVPDILCVAKSLGGGVATIGATITRSAIQKTAYGKIDECLVHTSTFGGRNRAAAVALEAVNVAVEEDFAGRARDVGGWLRGRLEELREKHPDVVRAVRGTGLMLGLEFHPVQLTGWSSALRVAGLERIVASYFPGIVGAELLRRHGIVASFVLNNPHVMRIYPALVATREDLAVVPRALDELLTDGVGKMVERTVGAAVKHAGLGALLAWAGGGK